MDILWKNYSEDKNIDIVWEDAPEQKTQKTNIVWEDTPKPTTISKPLVSWDNPQLTPQKNIIESMPATSTVPMDDRGTAIQAHKGTTPTEPFMTKDFQSEGQQIAELTIKALKKGRALALEKPSKEHEYLLDDFGTQFARGATEALLRATPEEKSNPNSTVGKLGNLAGATTEQIVELFSISKLFTPNKINLFKTMATQSGIDRILTEQEPEEKIKDYFTNDIPRAALTAGVFRLAETTNIPLSEATLRYTAPLARVIARTKNLDLNNISTEEVLMATDKALKSVGYLFKASVSGAAQFAGLKAMGVSTDEAAIDAIATGLFAGTQGVKYKGLDGEPLYKSGPADIKEGANTLERFSRPEQLPIGTKNKQSMPIPTDTTMRQTPQEISGETVVPEKNIVWDNTSTYKEPSLSETSYSNIRNEIGTNRQVYVPEDVRGDWLQARNKHPFMFTYKRVNNNGTTNDTPDIIAERLGITEDELRNQLLSENLKKTNEDYQSDIFHQQNVFSAHQQNQEIAKEFSNISPEEISQLVNAPKEQLDIVTKSLENDGYFISAEEFRDVIRNIHENNQEINAFTEIQGNNPEEFKLSSDIGEYNSEQQRIFEQQQQELSLKNEIDILDKKYNTNGEDIVGQQQDMFGNETIDVGKNTNLFSQKAGENYSFDNYNKNDNLSHDEIQRNNETYAEKKRNLIDLPELLEIHKSITNNLGDIKAVRSFSKEGLKGRAKGLDIDLLAELAKGNIVNTMNPTKAIDMVKFKKDTLEKIGGKESDFIFAKTLQNGKPVFKAYDKDQSVLLKTLQHEIGHVIDAVPEGIKNKNNILGKIANTKNYIKDTLKAYPNGPAERLSKADYNRIDKISKEQATSVNTVVNENLQEIEIPLNAEDIVNVWNNVSDRDTNPKLTDYIARLSANEKKSIVVEALKGKVADWVTFRNTMVVPGEKTTITKESFDKNKYRKLYDNLIKEELQKRGIFYKTKITEELKALSKEWRPWDRKTTSAGHIKYRDSVNELYADALSVLLNNQPLLLKMAPTFNLAFHNYLDSKPEFKRIYDEINNRIDSGSDNVIENRLNSIREMFQQSDINAKNRAELANNKELKYSWKDELLAIFVDKKQYLWKKIDEASKGADKDKAWKLQDLQDLMEELEYSASVAFDYIREVNNQVVAPLLELGITMSDINSYIFLRRTATERKYFINPKLMTGDAAEETFAGLQQSLGTEKVNAIGTALDSWFELRKELIIKRIEECGSESEELINYMKDNKNWAYFQLEEYLNDGGFSNNMDSQVHNQYGTAKDITAPFSASVAKDISLLRKSMFTESKKSVVSFLKETFPNEIFPAKSKWNGTYHEIQPVLSVNAKDNYPEGFDKRDFELIQYSQNGKPVGYYIDKEIAGIFNRNPYKGNMIINSILAINSVLKSIFVGKNPAWMVANIVRDTARVMQNISGIKTFIYMIDALPHAYKDVFKNISTDVLREMYQNKEIVVGRTFNSKEQLDTLDQFERLDLSFQKNKSKDWLGKAGEFSEKWTRIAAHIGLKEQQLYKPTRLASIIREEATTPNALAGGKWTPALNQIFYFSNMTTRGLIGDYRAFKRNPSRFAFWLAGSVMFPLILTLLLESGFFGDEKADEMRRIPTRDKSNRLLLPFGITPSGKAKYLKTPPLPFAGSLQSMLYRTIHLLDNESINNILADAYTLFPWGTMNPFIQVANAWKNLAIGRNTIDNFSGQEVVKKNNLDAGFSPASKDVLTYTYNSFLGGLIYRINASNKNALVNSNIEKMLKTPLIGPFLGRFVGISDSGLQEEEIKLKKEEVKQKAIQTIEVNDSIDKDIEAIYQTNSSEESKVYEKALMQEISRRSSSLYQDLQRKGTLTPDNKLKDFKEKYAKKALIKIYPYEGYVKMVTRESNKKDRESMFQRHPETRRIYSGYETLKR